MMPRAYTYLLVACLLGAPAIARAGEIYRYEEADGTIVYTNVPPRGAKAKGAQAPPRKVSGSFQATPRPQGQVAPRTVRIDRAEYDGYIRRAARRYRIPEALVWAVMHTESNFDPHAVSRVGASGLMQLMPATAEEMYVSDIFDIQQNIDGGTRYLRVLANMFDGDMVKMVAAYNAGPHAVKRYGGKVPPYAETQAYVQKVISRYYQYKKQHEARLAAEEAELASAQDG
jgi:soluble lytic murein transglycosylase-like protein